MGTQPVTTTRDPYYLREGEARRLLSGAPWRRFVVLGDGHCCGHGACAGDHELTPWAGRVATALRAVHPDLAYRDLSEPGLSFADVRAQQLPAALTFGGDLAAVSCGLTDVLRRSFDPDAVDVELSRIVAPLRDAGCEVLVIGMYDTASAGLVAVAHRAALRARLKLLADRIRAVSLRHGALHVDLVAHPAGAARDIWCRAGRHVSNRGHAIAATAAIRRLGAQLGASSEF